MKDDTDNLTPELPGLPSTSERLERFVAGGIAAQRAADLALEQWDGTERRGRRPERDPIDQATMQAALAALVRAQQLRAKAEQKRGAACDLAETQAAQFEGAAAQLLRDALEPRP